MVLAKHDSAVAAEAQVLLGSLVGEIVFGNDYSMV
jgi:hypothetical protein